MRTSKISSYGTALISGYSNTLLSLAFGLWITRYILGYFDNSTYGTYILIIETLGALEILDFGFSGGMVAFLSRETDNYARINKLVSTLFYCQVALALLAFVVVLVILIEPTVLFANTSSIVSLRSCVFLGGVSVVIGMISKSFSNMLYARKRITSDNVFKILSIFIRAALIFFLFRYFPRIEFLLGVTIITQVINLIQMNRTFRNADKNIMLRLKYFDWDTLKSVWAVSGWFAFGAIAILLIERFDNIMTSIVIGTGAIASLVVTRKLYDISRVFIFQINNTYRPYFGGLFGDNKNEEAWQKFKNISWYSIFLALFVGSAIILFNREFCEIWVGKEIYAGTQVSILLFFNLYMHAWKISYRVFLSSNLITKELAISSFIEGILNVIGAVLLGSLYGLAGIVASTFISGIIVQTGTLAFIFSTHKFESLRAFFKRNIEGFLWAVLLAGASWIILLLLTNIYLKFASWAFMISVTAIVFKKMYFSQYTFYQLIRLKIL